MKKILSLIIITAIFAACGGNGVDKKAQLADLKVKQADLSAQISALEKELGASDNTERENKIHLNCVSDPHSIQQFY